MEDDSKSSLTFCPASVKDNEEELLTGRSYAHYSAVPKNVTTTSSVNLSPGTPCVLGVDEAGRGPVIGPMVYGVFYLPVDIEQSLLATTHHFDDSKVLTPAVRAALMQAVCTPGTDLFDSCGWAVKSLSAPDIGAGMLKNGGSYNLNAQAMDATVELIRGVIQQGVNVTELYVDTIGRPEIYQKKLQLIFPTVKVRVEKKADSLYPCVSAASVVAKVTRDVSCEALLEAYVQQEELSPEGEAASWGSGYPSDARCVSWLKAAIEPVWGFGNECRFSWGTVKDMLEQKGGSVKRTDWPADGDQDNMRLSSYFAQDGPSGPKSESDELRTWFGNSVGQEAF